MKARLAGLASLATLALLGCASSSSESTAASDTANPCRTDADCGVGSCVAGSCAAASSAIERVALEVIAPAAVSVGEYRQMRYLKAIELSSGGNVDINLDYVAALSVQATPPVPSCANLTTDSAGRIPVRVEVLQDPRVSGIASTSYVAASDGAAVDNSVTLRVPPGTADLYVVPSQDQSSFPLGDCTVVPILALGQSIQAGNVTFEQSMPLAQRLHVSVAIPVDGFGSSPLEGFTCDVVEPLLGRRLSNQVVLSTPVIANGVADYEFGIAFQPVLGVGSADLSGRELFRFTPPSTILAPTFYVARLAADLFGTNSVSISHITTLPAQVVVDGRVESDSSGEPIAAQVTAILRNVSDIKSGAIAQYRASAATDTQGNFHMSLLAGEYDVVTTPLNSQGYASQIGKWSVSADPAKQSDSVVKLTTSTALTGRVVGNTIDIPHFTANVMLVPTSIGQARTFIDTLVDNSTQFDRRSVSTSVDTKGNFTLSADSGSYDLSVRPADGTGYPWSIRPNTVVGEGQAALSPLQLSPPFMFSGLVTVPGGTSSGGPVVLPGALIRAYAMYGKDGRLVGDLATATSAVQIGEARASSAGHYELLLPATLE